jgi:hypothetical protein
MINKTSIYIFLIILIILILLNKIFYENFTDDQPMCTICDNIGTGKCGSDFSNLCTTKGQCKISKTDKDDNICYCVLKK